MPPPSALNIKASSVTRLVKEEKSYHKELVQQTEKLKKMQQKQDNGEGDDEFKYEIKQQTTVVEQTKEVIPPVREKLRRAVEELELALQAVDDSKETPEVIEKARTAVEQGKEVLASKLEV